MKMKEFKYNIVDLIQCVRDRPCLWDKRVENYKDRVDRRNAWEEIFNILDDSYEEMSHEEKRSMGETVLNKWTNVRDTFVKSLKTKIGRPKRKYTLHEHLKFLTKIIPTSSEDSLQYSAEDTFVKAEDEIVYEVKDVDQDTNEFEVSQSKDKHDLTDDSTAHSSNEDYVPRKRSKRSQYSRNLEKVDDFDFVEVDEKTDPRIMNEDEAFFASLLPMVVKYNEDERLEFRIEVLSAMKRIKEKRQWTNDDE